MYAKVFIDGVPSGQLPRKLTSTQAKDELVKRFPGITFNCVWFEHNAWQVTTKN